jgi:hypothetical protein
VKLVKIAIFWAYSPQQEEEQQQQQNFLPALARLEGVYLSKNNDNFSKNFEKFR